MSDLYQLGEYEVDVRRRQLRREGELVPLPQKPFEVLLVLIERQGGAVTKEELMNAVWQNAFVEESNLTQSIFLLRKALADRASGARYILTLPGVGYQLGVNPVAIEPVAIKPVAIEPVAIEPVAIKPVAIKPVAEADPEAEIVPIAALAEESSAAERVPQPPARSRLRLLAVAVAVVVALVAGGFGLWRLLRPVPFHTFSLKRLTNSGDVRLTAVSRSGRYLAYVSRSSAGAEALSVLDLHGGSSRVELQDSAITYDDLSFSPDEAYVYYRSHRKDDAQEISSESRIAVLGGAPALVVNDIDGPATFIGKGERICFWRGSSPSQFAFLSVDAETGKDEQTLARGGRPIPLSAVCSPDGQRAAISAEVGGISILDFKTGQRQPFYSSPLGDEIYRDLLWSADGSQILGSSATPFNLDPALLTISYPGAVAHPITHDLSSYLSPGMTGDGSILVARRSEPNVHFQSFELPLPADSQEVISFPWTRFLGWQSDQEIVGSTASGGLKRKNLTTSEESPVLTSHGMQFLQPSGCGDSALVAAGGRPPDHNINVWHINADGSNPQQLTHGAEDILPVCTPDGKWVVYADNSSLKDAAIYRVPASGGAAAQIGRGSVWFAVSHDGERVAWVGGTSGKQILILARITTGEPLATVPLPPNAHASRSITFAPNDQHIFFMVRGETADSVWDLPLDGSAASKQIEFRGTHLGTLMVSPGGRYLGVLTTKPVSDAVLLEDGR